MLVLEEKIWIVAAGVADVCGSSCTVWEIFKLSGCCKAAADLAETPLKDAICLKLKDWDEEEEEEAVEGDEEVLQDEQVPEASTEDTQVLEDGTFLEAAWSCFLAAWRACKSSLPGSSAGAGGVTVRFE